MSELGRGENVKDKRQTTQLNASCTTIFIRVTIETLVRSKNVLLPPSKPARSALALGAFIERPTPSNVYLSLRKHYVVYDCRVELSGNFMIYEAR